MKVLLALVFLVLMALAAGPRVQGRLPLSRRFFLVGGEFLLLGWAIGEQGLGLLDRTTLDALAPLVTLGLGWIGLLVGLQFEWRILRRIPGAFHGIAWIQGLVTMLFLYALSYSALGQLFGTGTDTQAAALLLAAAGATSSQDVLALAVREKGRCPHAPLHLYRYSAATDSLIPIFVLALLFGLQHERSLFSSDTLGWIAALRWTGLAAALGIAIGFLAAFLLAGVRDESRFLLLVVGILVFSGGIASALGFPALFVNFVAGVVLVNIAGHRRRVWNIALSSERPFYIIFLVLVGAGWRLGNPWMMALLPFYVSVRLAAKMLGLNWGGRLLMPTAPLGWRAGLTLSGHGGVTVAVVASIQLVERGTLADSALSLLLFAVLASALFAPGITLKGLERRVRP